MTVKEKKQYLTNFKAINANIERLQNDLVRWWCLATKCSSDYSDIPKSSLKGNDKIQTAVEMMERISCEIEKFIFLKNNVEDSINTIDDEDLKLILRYRYIDGLKWAEISDKMMLNIRWIYRLHNRALERIKIRHYTPLYTSKKCGIIV